MKKAKREEWESNRNVQQRPKKSGQRMWCLCDRYIVKINEKCPGCGRKESNKAFKK